ncbi:MAG: hypothetical protein GWN56_07235 [Nitrosopumilaceae archaeon]|nr:hypothetical protein [Nitrosopumilaceae archaeon]
MIKINLLPVEERRSVEGFGQFVFGILIIAVAIALMVGAIIVQNNKIKDIKAETAKVNKRIKELDSIRKQVEKFKVQNKKLEQRIKVIAQLEKNRVGPLYVMDSLSTEIPERAWIGSFTTRGSTAKISGIASSEFVISEFMRNLESSPHFRNINLSKITNKKVSGKTFKSFGLSAGISFFKPPEETGAKKSDKTADSTVIKSAPDTTVLKTVEKSVMTEGMEVIDKSKTQIKDENKNSKDVKDDNKDVDNDSDKKPETKKKPTTGVVGSDDGSNVIVF